MTGIQKGGTNTGGQFERFVVSHPATNELKTIECIKNRVQRFYWFLLPASTARALHLVACVFFLEPGRIEHNKTRQLY